MSLSILNSNLQRPGLQSLFCSLCEFGMKWQVRHLSSEKTEEIYRRSYCDVTHWFLKSHFEAVTTLLF